MNKTDFKNRVFDLSEHIYPMVFRMLGNHNGAEDAIQEIMMKLWLKRKKIEHHPNLKGLVILTARNHCIDVLRKKMKIIPIENHEFRDAKTHEDSIFNWEQLNGIIHKILSKAPEQQRDVFLMRDIDGYDFKEIAFTLNITVEHSRVLLSRARKLIAKELETTYHYERGTY